MDAALPWNNPLPEAVVDHVVARLDLVPGSRLLDVGCGRGELLARALTTAGVTATGIDPDQAELERARARLGEASARVVWHACGVADVPPPDRAAGSFDAALCIGATHAFADRREGLPATLDALTVLLRPGGVLAVAEGYWRQLPDAGYLAATGIGRDDYRTHAENLALGERRGLLPEFIAVSSLGDWDHFEGAHERAALEPHARHPEDEAARARAEQRRVWTDAYRRWGRATLGFAVYVFRLPVASARRSGSRPTASA